MARSRWLTLLVKTSKLWSEKQNSCENILKLQKDFIPTELEYVDLTDWWKENRFEKYIVLIGRFSLVFGIVRMLFFDQIEIYAMIVIVVKSN